MNIDETKYRDKVIRTYIKNRNWDKNNEFLLKQKLLLNSDQLLPKYPFVVEDEWEVEFGRSDSGLGDLIFTDGNGNFAVVEIKYIDNLNSGDTASNRRTKKRQKVREQSVKYADIYSKNKFVKSIRAFIFTNDNPSPIEINI
ncbi:hypothetical protein [Geminocystis herdmanii]|uniref:hypothetical protein n=1 Tax=Geminocystis herdmanii TaxID=669359 RepID=UPI0003491823|nr:hypothetical protein [Geminocystis herdmanii]